MKDTQNTTEKKAGNVKGITELPAKENSLYLPIKQKYFDEIVAGTKKEEYREVTCTTYKKYLQTDKEGWPVLNTPLPLDGKCLSRWNNGICPLMPKESIKYLHLVVGYHKERDSMMVEVTGFSFVPVLCEGSDKPFLMRDENNERYVYDPCGDLCFWEIVFHLGKIVKLHRKGE